MSQPQKPVGVLLAGGLARRMGGGDKCLLPLGDKTLLAHSVERSRDQVSELLLSANGNALRFARTKLPVVPDVFADNPGPMAGIHAAMSWMSTNSDSEWLASFACDTPFFPTNLIEQLAAASSDETKIIVASSGGRMQPVFALWHKSLLSDFAATLGSGDDIPWLQHWIAERPHAVVEFTSEACDPFLNINVPADLYLAQELLGKIG
ncbi:molybdenum cofactor guanylyltransferase MobA [Gilvimarinus polysaccharolyticus]|uniref:molybdenum cofactor guanylyltransferase MobA n=1 Tax=Gilvimarinus polysaccharolyticus TaxID=863921 RepID=UPI0009FF6759|nr:molybdenum cofactor guanylyltransferase MobA [Gilvimarinus polysaccharolyticus]